jgi:uncharacterized YigZ family protein
MNYYTINDYIKASFFEKKSEFICSLKHCENETEAVDFINKTREMHRKATHNVYAYFLRENNISRYSDDGEPQGTAGVPVSEVLRKSELTDVCCVVTRYFGGILLGGGGLVRAYSHAVTLAIEEAKSCSEFLNMKQSRKMRLLSSYPDYGKLKFLLENTPSDEFRILSEKFAENVSLDIIVTTEYENTLVKNCTEKSNGKVQIEILDFSYFSYI